MITLLFLYLQLKASAAPIPLTSSSSFIAAKPGLFHSSLGYSLHAAETNWVQVRPPQNNRYIETVYRASENEDVQAALTVRADKLNQPAELSEYASKWIKDYSRFGFQILSSKKVRVGEEVGFMLDLVHQDTSKQLRQILFLKDKNVVTLTCRDDIKNFSQTLKSCNDIIRTFHW